MMTMFLDIELVFIALILDEEEQEQVIKNEYEFIKHGKIEKQKENLPLYTRN